MILKSPGGTISLTTMMLLTFGKMQLFSQKWVNWFLSVTTNLNINFLCKLRLDLNLLGESTLLKVGKSLAVVQVIIYSKNMKESLIHVT